MAFVRSVVGLAVAILITALPARAETPLETVYTRQEAALAAGGPADALRAEARKRTRIRVIVGLTLKMRPETALAPQAVDAQRQALRETQDRVVARTRVPEPDVVRFDTIPYLSLFVEGEGLEALFRDPDVVSVQLDRPAKPLLRDSVKIIHADTVFAKGFGGSGRVVAVLDTGVDAAHPMFARKIASEACFSTTNASSNSKSFCPGGAASSFAKGSAADCPAAVDGCFHGTHVSSIAVGNAETIDGVARDARLIAIKVFSKFTEESDCDGPAPCALSFHTDQIKGLERVFDLRGSFSIDAVNMSIGSGLHDTACDTFNAAFKAVVDNLKTAGIATVIASGNDGEDGKISSPACVSTAIAVGNTTKTDFVSESSNHSALVKLLAPGSKILAAGPRKSLVRLSGTSMAAPHVAGAFAQLRDAKLNASVDDMVEALSCSGKTVYERTFAGFDPLPVTPQRPRIDVLGAYSWLAAPPRNERNWFFSNAAEERDWTEARGDWELKDGVYRPKTLEIGISAAYAANCSGSFRAEAKILLKDPLRTCGVLGGLVFKASMNHATDRMSGYFANLGLCSGDPDPDFTGRASLFKMTDVKISPPVDTSGITLLCEAPVKANLTSANLFKIVSNGSSHSLFLNSVDVCAADDASFPTGVIGPLVQIGDLPPDRAFELRELLTRSTDISPVDPATMVIDASAYAPKAASRGIGIGLELAGAGAAW